MSAPGQAYIYKPTAFPKATAAACCCCLLVGNKLTWRLTHLYARLSRSVGRDFDGVAVDGDLRRITGDGDYKVKPFACSQTVTTFN